LLTVNSSDLAVCVLAFDSVYLFTRNLETPSTPMQILNDRLHKVDDKNKTLDERKRMVMFKRQTI